VPIVALYYVSIIVLWIANRRRKAKPAFKPMAAIEPRLQPVAESVVEARTPIPVTMAAAPAAIPKRQSASVDGLLAAPSSTLKLKQPTGQPIYRATVKPRLPAFRRPRLSIDGLM
jgi:hypothetical protein